MESIWPRSCVFFTMIRSPVTPSPTRALACRRSKGTRTARRSRLRRESTLRRAPSWAASPVSSDCADSVLDRELPDTEIVISQPFWPAYMTAERFAKARKLKLVVTAGIGSDHTDLQAAMDRGVTVAEVTYCNSNSVAEHIVMMILSLVRNYIPSYNWVIKGGWNIADCVARSYDLEGMQVGTVAAGRIGLRALRLLKPFDVKLHYLDRHRLPESVEKEINLTHHTSLESLTRVCDVVTLNCPLH